MAIDESNYDVTFKNKVLPWAKKYEVKKFKGKKGKELAYICFNKKGAKDVLIFSSGRCESIPRYFEFAYDIFHSQLKANICLYDHRGQGLSERIISDPRKGHVDNFSYYTDDIIKFMEILKSKGSSKLFLWGQSMGGGIAIRAAQKRPDLVAGLTLFSPLVGMYTKPFPNWLVYGFTSGMDLFSMGSRFMPGQTYWDPDPTVEGYKKNLNVRSLSRWLMTEEIFSFKKKEWQQAPLGGATIKWIQQALKMSKFIQKDAEKLVTPTYIFQSGNDPNVIPEKHEYLCQKAKNCQLHSFDQEKYKDKNGVLPRHDLLMDTDNIRKEIFQKSFQFMKKLGMK